jgi:hypothetical protein
MKISKLALIALLGGALMAFGCGDDSSSTSGSAGAGGDGGAGGAGGEGGMGGAPGGECESTACVFCPAEALGTAGAVIGDILVPIDFTAVAQGAVVQGTTVTVDLAASSAVNDLGLEVAAMIVDGSKIVYSATMGGSGMSEIPIPEQPLTGMSLLIDGGSGTGDFDVDAAATELVIQVTSALIDLQVTSPVPLPLTLDASEGGDCEVLGGGVTIPVDGAM